MRNTLCLFAYTNIPCEPDSHVGLFGPWRQTTREIRSIIDLFLMFCVCLRGTSVEIVQISWRNCEHSKRGVRVSLRAFEACIWGSQAGQTGTTDICSKVVCYLFGANIPDRLFSVFPTQIARPLDTSRHTRPHSHCHLSTLRIINNYLCCTFRSSSCKRRRFSFALH